MANNLDLTSSVTNAVDAASKTVQQAAEQAARSISTSGSLSKNTDIFNSFDMVVSITQQTINSQLTHLTKIGTISDQLIIEKVVTNNVTSFQSHASDADLAVDDNGTPVNACISGYIVPQVNIAKSGTDIGFVIKFKSGTAYFKQGNPAKLVQYDMTGWTYTINVPLNLAALDKSKFKLSADAEKQVKAFTDDMFKVNNLFLDFNSVNTAQITPIATTTADSATTAQFVLFMASYIETLKLAKNPYILGYNVEQPDSANVPSSASIPETLRPVGTTFSLYYDPANSKLSTLNYLMVSKGHSLPSNYGVFTSNWISASEQCDAKMIYSAKSFSEEFILKPVYYSIRDSFYNTINPKVGIDKGNEYDGAKSMLPAGGYTFVVCNDTDGNTQYQNIYNVTIENKSPDSVIFHFSGSVHLYKKAKKNMGFCTATATANTSITWSGSMTLTCTADAQGNPTLSLVDNGFTSSKPESSTHKNDCAKGWDIVGDVFGGFLGVLNLFTDNFFSDLFKTNVSFVNNIAVGITNMSSTVKSTVMLPAGDVFYMKNPSADGTANLSLALTYKSDN